MIFQKYTLDDYLKRYGMVSRKVYEVNKVHPLLDNVTLKIYYEDVRATKDKSRFILFNNDEFVPNALNFEAPIEDDLVLKIAKEIVQTIINNSDFSDLDMELSGKVPCEEFKDTYKKCEECPHFMYGPLKSKNSNCGGAYYVIPDSIDSFSIYKKYEKILGENSESYKEYKIKEIINGIYNLKFLKLENHDVNRILDELFE